MAKTKGAIVGAAFRRAGISGITSQPTGDELSGAVELLEDTMRELDAMNACPSYAFEDAPSLSTDSKLEAKWYNAVQSRLAVMLCGDYGLPVPQTLAAQSRASWSGMIGKLTIPKMNTQPSRMPRGSGNTQRFPSWARYFNRVTKAPVDCNTIHIKVGEDFAADISFADFLQAGETIQSITTDVSDGLTLDYALINPDGESVALSVEGAKAGAHSVLIKIVTTAERDYPERVWFDVKEP